MITVSPRLLGWLIIVALLMLCLFLSQLVPLIVRELQRYLEVLP
jgi:hypothetical protein